MKRQATNALILVAVIVLVAGVAWFRTARQDGPGAANDATAAVDHSPGATASPVQKGELCPEPPPTAKADDGPTTGPATRANGSTAAKKLPRVVDLGADKCKACIELAPILEQLRKEYAGRVTVEFIDVWKNPKAATPYKIRVIPTQIFYDKDGKEVWRHEGFLPKVDFIAKFREMGVR